MTEKKTKVGMLEDRSGNVSMPEDRSGKVSMPEDKSGKVSKPKEKLVKTAAPKKIVRHRNKYYCPECGTKYPSESSTFCSHCKHPREVPKTW